MIKRLLWITALLFLFGCMPQSQKVVEAVISSILEPVSITVTPTLDLGEIIVGEEDRALVIEVKNNSSDSIRKLSLSMDSKQSVIRFTLNEIGEASSPGLGGTCASELRAKESCTYAITFSTKRSGVYSIPLVFSYENLVEPQQKTIVITGTVGEGASLSLTSEKTKYDFGVLEQTDSTARTLDLELQNTGGLIARDVAINLTNQENPAAFSILSNDCATTLMSSSKCHIKIAYAPKNNNYADPEQQYTGKIQVTYVKSLGGQTAQLNISFTFHASTIEAKFITNFPPINFDTSVVAGTKVSRSIKVTNNGYRSGEIKSLDFYSSGGSRIARCITGTGLILDCQSSLADLPFVIEDTSSCVGKLVEGNVGKTPGLSCFFQVTYWPPKSYAPGSQALHNFNGATLGLSYDSRWLEKENIVEKKNMFNITADFLSTGYLVLDSIMQDSANLDNQFIEISSAAKPEYMYRVNLGRIAKVSSAEYDTFYKITYRNIGESPVTLVSLTDEARPLPFHTITDVGTDFNSYYRGVKYVSCATVAPGATCSVSFLLTPIASNPETENALMYDENFDPSDQAKIFHFTYSDGSLFEDDGTPTWNPRLSVRLKSKLVAKGFLSFVEPLSQNFPSIVNGQTVNRAINLKNSGTGPIYAISFLKDKHLVASAGTNNWPLQIVSGTPVAPATKDCTTLFYPENSPVAPPFGSDALDLSRYLLANETCTFWIQVKAPPLAVVQDFPLAQDDYKRYFIPSDNGTANLWTKDKFTVNAAKVAFKYFDGDYISTDPFSTIFGYPQVTKEMAISQTINPPANLVLMNPLPSTSAVIIRPALNYPQISQTVPTNLTYASKTVPRKYFDSSYFTAGGVFNTSAAAASIYLPSLNLTPSEYLVHIGTFPVGSSISATVTIANVGGIGANNFQLSEEVKAGSPIAVRTINGVSPFLTINVPQGQNAIVAFNFSPLAQGQFTRCYTVGYDDPRFGRMEQRFCVRGDAVAAYPRLKAELISYNVTYDPNTNVVSEIASAPTLIDMPLNGLNSSQVSTVRAVRSSLAHGVVTFRITNIGSASVTGLNYGFLLNGTGSAVPLPSELKIRASSTCGSVRTLAQNASCDFTLEYIPVQSTPATLTYALGFVYDIASSKNQFVSQSLLFNASAIDPANVSINKTGVSSETPVNWSDALHPVQVTKSWPIDLASYSDVATPTHALLVNNPSEVQKTTAVFPLKNSSSVKASFLASNPNPLPGTWNIILTNADVTIYANRYCFYGDDEFNNAIPLEEKGFNSTSVNVCSIYVELKAGYTYPTCSAWNAVGPKTKTVLLGGNITQSCNPYVYGLPYYSFGRSTQEKMYVHLKGFIEPNRTTAQNVGSFFVDASVQNTTGSGNVSFSWNSFTENNGAWGSIIKYRVFYSTSSSELHSNKLFYAPIPPSFKDVPLGTNSVTITGLTQGNYYFFRVVPIRAYAHPTFGNLVYASIASNLPLLTLPIPTTLYTYYHPFKALIDKSYQSTTANRTTGMSKCASLKFDQKVNGVARSLTKKLIDSNIWALLRLPANSFASSGYPGNAVPAVPHWLSDNAYNIRTNVTLSDGTTLPGLPSYDPQKMEVVDLVNKTVYRKTCNNSDSCNLLYKIVGGDDQSSFYDGTMFAAAGSLNLFIRCYSIVQCPTNIAKLITDPTCAAP